MIEYGWGGMGIGMGLLWVVVVVALILLVKNFRGAYAGKSGAPEKSALDIL
jgi:uncharacterized membrane protein